MLAVAAAVITLILAILSVFFSKSGERARVTSVGYIMLCLIIVSGLMSVNSAINGAATSRDLQIAVDAANSQLGDLKAQVVAGQISADATVSSVVFSISAPLNAGFAKEMPEGYIGPLPIVVAGIDYIKVSMSITDVLEAVVSLEPLASDAAESDAEFHYTAAEVVFPGGVGKSKQCTRSHCTDEGSRGRLWFAEMIAPYEAVGMSVDIDASVRKVIARVLQFPDVGTIEIAHGPSFDGIKYAAWVQKEFDFELKVFMKETSDDQECKRVITFPLALRRQSENEGAAGSSVYDVSLQPGYKFENCMFVPI